MDKCEFGSFFGAILVRYCAFLVAILVVCIAFRVGQLLDRVDVLEHQVQEVQRTLTVEDAPASGGEGA